ncbi:hypothetical protein B0H11DRAFT_2082705 [Mycena galericulata]|nr:hypothetical protein B0H11DRAFT_2082705 [Mycena galericulata]
MRDFSQELVDLVIDHVSTRDDGKALSAQRDLAEPLRYPFHPLVHFDRDRIAKVQQCRLVCKAWFPRSSFHVFRTLFLLGGDRVRGFSDLLETSSLDLLALIQSLHIAYSDSKTFVNEEDMVKLNRFPNLVCLSLDVPASFDVSNSRYFHDTFLRTQIPIWRVNSPLLSRLELDFRIALEETQFGIPLGTIADIVSFFPSLEALKLTTLAKVVQSSDEPRYSLPPGLHTLEITHRSMEAFFSWLTAHPIRPMLKTLTIPASHNGRKWCEAFRVYYQHAGSNMESLSVYDSRFIEEEKFADLLQHLSRLRHLYLDGEAAARIATILGMLLPPKLETITILLWGPRRLVPYYNLIDEALSHSCFRSLQSFSLAGSWSYTKAPVNFITETRALMPLADARGILH